jgi:hypothetical protein
LDATDDFFHLFDTTLEPAPKTENTEWNAQAITLEQITEIVVLKGRELKALQSKL